jgi:predicted nucleotidyltransferase
MNTVETNALFRTVVGEVLKNYGAILTRIILFGSRARDTAGIMSDWDYMVLYRGQLNRRQLSNSKFWIKRRMAAEGIDVDLVLLDQNAFEVSSNDVGHIAHYAIKSGVVI